MKILVFHKNLEQQEGKGGGGTHPVLHAPIIHCEPWLIAIPKKTLRGNRTRFSAYEDQGNNAKRSTARSDFCKAPYRCGVRTLRSI